MPGYLTAIKTLIDADDWLGQIVTTLDQEHNKSALEEQIFLLATQVRNYLRFTYDPSVTTQYFPLPRQVAMDGQPGTGLSKYAMTGALGPDIPAASNILGVNQRWVSDTMHLGSPRRAWQNAGTTSLVTKPLTQGVIRDLISKLNEPDHDLYQSTIGVGPGPSLEVLAEFKKPYMALMIGHLTSIATHVVINPFLNQWAWNNDEITRQQFSVQVDAMLAIAYFHRKDLHDGPSWSGYLHADFWPHNDTTTDFVAETYATSFTSVYGNTPKEILCALPPLPALIQQFPALDQVLKNYPEVRDALANYSGHDDKNAHDVLDSVLDPKPLESQGPVDTMAQQPRGFLARHALEDIDGVNDLLDKYQCLAGQADRDFFTDGLRNTRNWALDAGYDHAPGYMSAFMTALVALGAVNPNAFLNKAGLGTVYNVWSSTVAFDGDDDVKANNQKAWVDNGINPIENDRIWFDFIDGSYGACAIPMWLYNALLSGVKIPKWLPGIRPAAEYLGLTDGFFGAGSDANDPWYVGPYVFVNDFLGPLFLFPFVLQQWEAKWYRESLSGVTKWLILIFVSIGMDALEALWMTRGMVGLFKGRLTAKERGANGDELGLRIWYLRLWMSLFYFLSTVLALGTKSAIDKPRNTDESLGVGYYLLGLVFPLIFIGAFIWKRSAFEREMVQRFAGVDWPDKDFRYVTQFVDNDVNTQDPRLVDGLGDETKVALFSPEQMKQVDGKYYYPDAEDKDPQTPWADRRAADEAVRRDPQNHTESDQSYRLKQLLDRAAMLGGMLSMALVNLDMAGDKTAKHPIDKDAAKAIFQDWNLEFLTTDQWNDLMETTKDGKPGVIKSVETWWKNLTAKPPQPTSQDVMAQVASVFGMTLADTVRPELKA